MLIRLQTKDGTKRLEVDDKCSLLDLRTKIEQEFKIPVTQQQLSARGPPKAELKSADNGKTITALGFQHGELLLLSYTGHIEDQTAPVKTAIVGGNVTTVADKPTLPEDDALKSLGEIKRHWKMEEFMARNAMLEFQIQNQKQAHTAKVSIPSAAGDNFTRFLQSGQFLQKRFAHLYGFVNDDMVEVEVIYEPPQETTVEEYTLLEDPNKAQLDQLVEHLGLQRVGCIITHFPRSAPADWPDDKAWVDMPCASELVDVARLQCDVRQTDQSAAQKFVFLSVSQRPDGNASWEAYQVSDQLGELVENGAVAVVQDSAKNVKVKDGRKFLVENKPTDEAPVEFFFNSVAVAQHEGVFRSSFPASNRADAQTVEKLRSVISTKGDQYVERIRDFHLLLFVYGMLDTSSMNNLCDIVLERDQSSCEGFELLINSFAGIDS